MDHAHPPSHPPAGVPPLLPADADPAQQSLVQALRASFNVLRVLMVVLVVLYLLSGVFRVEPDQQGLIARFGALRMNPKAENSPVFQPGWHLALPDPFDRKYTVTGMPLTLISTHFMFPHEKAGSSTDLADIVPQASELVPGRDGAMLTGDRNLSHGRWEVQYQVVDAAQFVQNVGNTPAGFERLLERLLESAVVREVAGRTVEEVTRAAIEAVRLGVHRRLQESLDRLGTGVQVVRVRASTTEPGAVRPAFLDVTRALTEKLRERDRAEEQASEIINQVAGDRSTHQDLLALITEFGEAQLRDATQAELDAILARIDTALLAAEQRGAGQIAVALRAARAEANTINEQVQREYEHFQKYVELRRVQPEIALLGLWVQMREEILSTRDNEIFFVPHAQEIEVLINRDPQRQLELEEERGRQRRRGPLTPSGQ